MATVRADRPAQSGATAPDHVCIVMATYNGAAHLEAQLQSLTAQTHACWSLHVGDDGSTDTTCAQLAAFAAAQGGRDITVAPGPQQGSAANFLTRATAALDSRPGAWLAFCDQDDVWLPHKLARALEAVGQVAAPPGTPVAYASRTQLVAADLTPQGLSAQPARPAGFRNALVQNILGGNTIVLNPAAAHLLAQSVPAALAADVPFHDWWTYLIVTGAGAQVVLDPEPGLLYRQHGDNMLGHHGRLKGRLARAWMLWNRVYAGWIDRNLAALTGARTLLTQTAQQDTAAFAHLRHARRGTARARGLATLGLYRQSAMGDRALRLLARSGRL